MGKKTKHSKRNKGKTAAFFDVDGTLVRFTTDLKIMNYLFRIGELPFSKLILFYYYVIMHKLDLLTIEQTIKFLGFLKGETKKRIDKITLKMFNERIKQGISKEMIAEVNIHNKQDHMTVILSNSPDIVVDHFRRYMGMNYTISSLLELNNGIFTGKVKQLCYGKYKLQQLNKFAKDKRIDLSKSYFYTDSFSDLPTLLAVGNRIAVNPDNKLRKYAEKHGWRIIIAKH